MSASIPYSLIRIGYSDSIISTETFDWFAPMWGTPCWPSCALVAPHVPMNVSQKTNALPSS